MRKCKYVGIMRNRAYKAWDATSPIFPQFLSEIPLLKCSVLKCSREVEFDLDRWGYTKIIRLVVSVSREMVFALPPCGLLADQALAHLEAM